jgi:hypothetical protein
MERKQFSTEIIPLNLECENNGFNFSKKKAKPFALDTTDSFGMFYY